LKSKPFKFLPIRPRNNLGGDLNLKTFLSRFKDLSSQKNKKTIKKERRQGKRGEH
jgi:hypothetical protein